MYRTFCFMAESTRYIQAQRSFRFSAERYKTLANGTLAKRLVGETTGHSERERVSLKPVPLAPFRVQTFPVNISVIFASVCKYFKVIFYERIITSAAGSQFLALTRSEKNGAYKNSNLP